MLNKELLKRTVFSIIIFSTVTLLIYFASYSGFQPIVAAVISLLAVFGVREFLNFCKNDFWMNKKFMLISAFCIAFSFYPSTIFPALDKLPIVIFFLFLFFLFLFHFKQVENAIGDLAVASFIQLYISIPLGLILFILISPQFLGLDGRIWVFYLIIVTKITDVVAYLSGKLVGKRPLAIKISPNKTFEGAFLGWLSAALMSWFFFWVLKKWFYITSITTFTSIFLGAILGILGQLGDLFESLIKRDAKVKDSSSIPGLGGVLDLLDSLIVNTFVLYFFLN